MNVDDNSSNSLVEKAGSSVESWDINLSGVVFLTSGLLGSSSSVKVTLWAEKVSSLRLRYYWLVLFCRMLDWIWDTCGGLGWVPTWICLLLLVSVFGINGAVGASERWSWSRIMSRDRWGVLCFIVDCGLYSGCWWWWVWASSSFISSLALGHIPKSLYIPPSLPSFKLNLSFLPQQVQQLTCITANLKLNTHHHLYNQSSIKL
jgi:hypothetical protein